MGAGPALRALLSHWWRSPLQLFTLLVGLALATALWSGVQAINSEARASYGAAAAQVDQSQLAQIVSNNEQPLAITDYVALRRAGWLITPQIVETLELNGETLRLIGVEPLTAPALQGSFNIQSIPVDQFFDGSGFALVAKGSEAAIEALGWDYNVAPNLAQGTAIADIGSVARIAMRGDTLDRLLVLPNNMQDAAALPQSLRYIAAAQDDGDIARLTDSFHLNLTAFGQLSFAVGLFIVYGAIGLAFEQRRTMFRTLRALGVSLRLLITLLIAELLIFATLAGLFGILLGYLIAAALLPDVAATLRGLYGADVTGTLQIRASWWLSGLGMAVGGTLVASIGTFLRLARLPLMDAGTPQAWAHASRRIMGIMGLLGIVLLAVALLLSSLAGSLVQGFLLLGCLLIGAAFLLPWTLDRCLAVLESISRKALPQWFWADTRSQVPGLSMALMALMLAIATNVGVSTMVSSFRLTFTGWLDQRLASELYVTLESADQADVMRRVLADDVKAFLPIVSAPTVLNGQAGEVYGVNDHATYRDHWPLLAQAKGVWDRLQDPATAIINEQLALRAGLSVGDPVPSAEGQEIIGIYSDYGNPAPQMIIGEASFRALYPEVMPLRFGLRVASDDIERVTQTLINEVGLSPNAVANQARIKALSLGIFEQTFTVTAALNILTLSVAGFSIMMSLLTLAQMRLPQLAPIWALGVTRAQLGRLELIRSVVLALVVTCLAIPLGLALSWVLLAVVNVAAFGWQLPMFVFQKSYLTLAAIALLAALIAAAWPALRLARIAPHQLLQVFSSGR
jgi:putative ABC transport system permease protein